MVVDRDFWRSRRVLLTGHTGFKGAWLVWWLQRLGATVSALALMPSGTDNLWRDLRLNREVDARIVDVRDAPGVERVFEEFRPQIVLHLAAQSLVRFAYREPRETYTTNVMGTINILEAARRVECVDAIVIVTSDKCYRNDGRHAPYSEDDPLGGDDPYSASKAAAELVTASYRASFGSTMGAIACARAGNVIGGGDWAQERLVPDIVRAIRAGGVPQLRYPLAIRPWQHVLEPLAGYLCLAQSLSAGNLQLARAYNFGPDSRDERTVADLTRSFLSAYDRAVDFKVDDIAQFHEASYLTIDSSRAKAELLWYPRFGVDDALTRTSRWYRDFSDGADPQALCDRDISAYEAVA